MNLPTAPTTRDYWNVKLPHPLADQPLTTKLSDTDCDDFVRRSFPEWDFAALPVQGRLKNGRRVICAQLVRKGVNQQALHNMGYTGPRAVFTLA